MSAMRAEDMRTEDLWQLKAACRGPQAAVFFPPTSFERKDEKLEREVRAKAICAQCPVREECLAGAMERREPWGVWGGELFLQGVVIPRKRPRGRPRKNEVAA